jgi:hypothetical protein
MPFYNYILMQLGDDILQSFWNAVELGCHFTQLCNAVGDCTVMQLGCHFFNPIKYNSVGHTILKSFTIPNSYILTAFPIQVYYSWDPNSYTAMQMGNVIL